MNKDSIIGGILIFIIIIGYSLWTAPSEEEIREQQRLESVKRANELRKHIEDSIYKVRLAQQNTQDESSKLEASNTGLATNDSISEQLDLKKYGAFAVAAKGSDQDIIIENDVLKLKISKKGGNISYAQVKGFRTYDTLPLIIFDKNTVDFSLLLNDKHVETRDLYFEPIINGMHSDQDSFHVATGENLTLSMRVYPNDEQGNINRNHFLEFEYIISGDNHMVDINLNMKGMSPYIPYSYIVLNWDMIMTGKEKDVVQERKHTTIYYKYKDQDVDYLSEASDEDSEELKTKVQWISFKQQFFSASLIAENAFKDADISIKVDENNPNPKYLETMHSEITIPLSNSEIEKFPMKMYFGPNKYKILKKYDLDLEQLIPLGWGFFLLHWINQYATIPVFDFLSGFGWNYGIIILVLTILLKIVLFPIAYKTYLSTAKMRVL